MSNVYHFGCDIHISHAAFDNLLAKYDVFALQIDNGFLIATQPQVVFGEE